MEALTSNIQAQLADGTTSPLRQQNRMRGGCTNLCIFAYGQTGTGEDVLELPLHVPFAITTASCGLAWYAGKTHTLEGGTTEADRGLIPRALELLFAEVDRLNNSTKRATANRRLSIALCVVEVYNENVRDLLSEGSSDNRLEVGVAQSML